MAQKLSVIGIDNARGVFHFGEKRENPQGVAGSEAPTMGFGG